MPAAVTLLTVLVVTGAVGGIFVGRFMAAKPTLRPQIIGAILGALAGAGVWFTLVNMAMRLSQVGS